MTYNDMEYLNGPDDLNELTAPKPEFEFIEDIEPKVRYEMCEKPPGMPLVWWPKFTELMNGLRPGELTVWSAPTGIGKTTATANIVCQTLLQSKGSYICSAEIGNAQFALSMYSALENKRYGDGTIISREAANAILDRQREIMRSGRLVFSKNDDRIAPEKLINEIRTAHEDFGVGVAILDNLQFFMPLADARDALTATDLAIRDFVHFIRTAPVHVILIAHPKKTLDNRVQDETSVKGSSTIYQECSNFIGMNRVPAEFLRNGFYPSDRELTFFKIRQLGWNMGKKVYFEFDNGRYREKCVEWR